MMLKVRDQTLPSSGGL